MEVEITDRAAAAPLRLHLANAKRLLSRDSGPLSVGQKVAYFDPQANASHVGQVLELRRKQAVVLNKATGQRWLISYAFIKMEWEFLTRYLGARAPEIVVHPPDAKGIAIECLGTIDRLRAPQRKRRNGHHRTLGIRLEFPLP